MHTNISELLKLLNTKLHNIKGILKPDDLNARLKERFKKRNHHKIFWNDVEKATKVELKKQNSWKTK